MIACATKPLKLPTMSRIISFLGYMLVVAVAGLVQAAEPGFEPMFNGKDLTGWEGKPGAWRVEDGAITAESTPENPCKRAHYIFWRGGRPGNFEMRAEFRLQGTGGNSGIQFRSREVGDWDISGYQADIENGVQWTGCLFEHQRGGVVMRGEKALIASDGKKKVEPLLTAEEKAKLPHTSPEDSLSAALMKQVKPGEWNTYTIVARGPEIALWINGIKMCEVRDEQTGAAARDGVIALQMHPGPPMKIQFRNLRIKNL
jgi:hypothetical protein